MQEKENDTWEVDYSRAITKALNDGKLEEAQFLIDSETPDMFGEDDDDFDIDEDIRAICSKCGSCLRENGEPVPDDMWLSEPVCHLFRCKNCGQVNFLEYV